MGLILAKPLCQHPAFDLIGFNMWLLGQFSLLALLVLLRQCVRMVRFETSGDESEETNVISA